jgi:uncharacterized paraquat-inducible protein A
MPLGMCAPCEKLYLFEEERSSQAATCPRCGAPLTPQVVQSMHDLPPFPFQLIRRQPACLVESAAA